MLGAFVLLHLGSDMPRLRLNWSERSEARFKMKNIYRVSERIAILTVVSIALLAPASPGAT
jgi:hypothetical protein